MKSYLVSISLSSILLLNAAPTPTQIELQHKLQTINFLKRQLPAVVESIHNNVPLRSIVILPENSPCDPVNTCPTDPDIVGCNVHITYPIYFSVLQQVLFRTRLIISDLQAALTFLIAEVGFLIEGILSGISEITTPTFSEYYPAIISTIALFIPISSIQATISVVTEIYTIISSDLILLLGQLIATFNNVDECDTAQVLFLKGVNKWITLLLNLLIEDQIRNIVTSLQRLLSVIIYDLLFVPAAFNVQQAIERVSAILMTDKVVDQFIVDVKTYLCNLQTDITFRIAELTCGKPIATRCPKTDALISCFARYTEKLLDLASEATLKELQNAT